MVKEVKYQAANDLHVEPVVTRKEEAIFVKLPFEIYRHNRNWVPPLISEEKKRWKIAYNNTLSGRPFKRFLAFRGKRAVGRIVASLDPHFTRKWEDGAGFFGFFECEKDYNSARALLCEAEKYLLSRDATKSIGPINLSLQDEVGCLTKGFDECHRVLTPYNPSYYSEFFESTGYKEYRKYLAFQWTPESSLNAAMHRISSLFLRRASDLDLIIRSVDDRNWKREARLLHELYNACFKDLWGFTPISWLEFLERTHRFRQFYVPELVLIAEVKGTAIGFGVLLPDINLVLKKLNGRIFPLGWLKSMKGVQKLQSGRFLLLGVRPNYTGRGLAALIAMQMAERCRKLNFNNVELSLIDDANNKIKRVITAAGCETIKTFKLYCKQLQ